MSGDVQAFSLLAVPARIRSPKRQGRDSAQFRSRKADALPNRREPQSRRTCPRHPHEGTSWIVLREQANLRSKNPPEMSKAASLKGQPAPSARESLVGSFHANHHQMLRARSLPNGHPQNSCAVSKGRYGGKLSPELSSTDSPGLLAPTAHKEPGFDSPSESQASECRTAGEAPPNSCHTRYLARL